MQGSDSSKSHAPRTPGFLISLTPILLLVVALFAAVRVGAPTQIPLLFAAAFASALAVWLGHPWKDVEEGLKRGIILALRACLILMVIGTLIGTWILSGIVPGMIYYGLKLLTPSLFLFMTCLICSIIALATGSSWSTAGTVGLALIGIGSALGVPMGMTAGAIVSGAYFGDKMSPLSDTTNLAPAVAGSELFTHIRHMIYTTGPSLTVALILYAVLGWRYRGNDLDMGAVNSILTALEQNFNLGPWLLLAPAAVIVMVIMRLPALPALFIGAFLGGVVGLVAQPGTGLIDVVNASWTGYVSQTGVEAVDGLLSRGGMQSMMATVALIFCALAFGGVMECSGMLGTLGGAILKLARGTGSLITATVATCIGVNVFAPDQYMAIVVPGRMYREAYLKRGLHPKNLSRALEDSGTLTSPLVPWNTCGAFMSATLGVSALAYLPFAFLNLLNPILSIVYGFTGFSIARLEPGDEEAVAGEKIPEPETTS
jgi:NhaC family Na+:H+ antiporter